MRREAGPGAAGQFIRAVALMLAGSVAAAMWVAHTRGLPAPVARMLMDAVAGPRTAVETSRVCLRGLQDVHVEGLRVYARGVVGPPGFECDRAVIQGSLLRALRGAGFVRELQVNRAVLRPAFLRPRGQAPPSRARLATPRTLGSYRLSADQFECAGVRVRNLACDVEPGADRIVGRNVRCRVGDEQAGSEDDCRGEVVIDPVARTVSGRFETAFVPSAVVPILRYYRMEFVCELIGRFAFTEAAPRSTFTFTKPMDAPSDLRVDSRLWMENARYRGVDVLRADATVIIDRSQGQTRVSLAPLVVSRDEGTARVDLTVDADQRLVRFDGTSTLEPRALTRLIGIFTNRWTDALVADGPYHVASSGIADLAGTARHSIRTVVRGGRFGAGALVVDNAAFTVLTEGATSRIERASGRLYDGAVAGTGAIVAASREGAASNEGYRASLSLSGADFQALAVSMRPNANIGDLRGRISVNLEVAGPLGSNWWHDVRGKGDVKVREGRVFMLPVFGGLSGYLARIVPGVDFMLRQGELTSDFVLENARARSDRISVEGDVFSLVGRGSYGFDRTLDVAVQVKLFKDDPLYAKVIRLITWPLSKLFEFRLTGTLDKPRWYPVNFSGELLEKLGLRNGRDERGGDDAER